MNISISKRNLIRLVSFIVAVVVSLGIFSFSSSSLVGQTNQKLENHYVKNISGLSENMQNIETSLVKIMYSNSPDTIKSISTDIWREASFAKESMAYLPLSQLNLENTYKFLSQVGEYCVSLANKVTEQSQMSARERENIKTFKNYADKFLQEILAMQDGINTGTISLQGVTSQVKDQEDEMVENEELNFSDGFMEFEDGFSAYPSLIYDGPFSDHIMQRSPIMLENAEKITRAEAKIVASKATKIPQAELLNDTDEEGKMPSYTFVLGDTNVAVTKAGGLLSYVIKYREVDSTDISIKKAIALAKEYLLDMGIDSVEESYYEVKDNLATINFAYKQDGVVCYTDLIKVSVAMDNGEILRYDGRGYITNHKRRNNLGVTITEEVAKSKISPVLQYESTKLCLIPDTNLDEILCYEFKCSSSDDEDILVYINAQTGAEEKILILYVGENGTLTK